MPYKILSINNNKTNHMIVKKTMNGYCRNFFEAENGIKGIEIASREKPDLIIMDTDLPIMDGIEVLGKLKEAPDLTNIPLIIITAITDKNKILKLAKMGVRNIIAKPIKPKLITETAKKLLPFDENPDDDILKEYLSLDGDIQELKMHKKITKTNIIEINTLLEPKIKKNIMSGAKKFILNLSEVERVTISLINLILHTIQNCREFKISYGIVCSKILELQLQDFSETSDIRFAHSIDEAKALL